jgi:hypothetical protein
LLAAEDKSLPAPDHVELVELIDGPDRLAQQHDLVLLEQKLRVDLFPQTPTARARSRR